MGVYSKIKLVYVAHQPVIYHSGLYKTLYDLKLLAKVVFLSEEGSKSTFVNEWNSEISWGERLLQGFEYEFSRQLKLTQSRYSFFGRFNPSLIFRLIKLNPTHVLLAGYTTFSDWMVVIYCLVFRKKLLIRGEAILSKKDNRILKKIYLKIFTKYSKAILYSCKGNYNYWLNYVNKEKLYPLSCAVDNDFFQSKKLSLLEEDIFRSNLGIKRSDFVFVQVGKLEPRKRPLELIEAAAVCENKDNIVLIFVGDGPLKSEIVKLREKHRMNIIITGFVTQDLICKYYSISNCGVSIAKYDPSPKTLNEGLNFDLPYIVGDLKEVGTSADLVLDGFNGFVWKNSSSIDDLSLLIDKMFYSSEVERNNNRSLSVINKYTFNRNAEEIKKILENI